MAVFSGNSALDKKIEEAVLKAIKDAKDNKPPEKTTDMLKDRLMKDMYEEMLDFHRKSSNSRPTLEQRNTYIERQNTRLQQLRQCDTLTARERIMFLAAERAMEKMRKMPIR